jgi:uncharacterized membrane protein YhaH (DUF805 family)
VLATEGTWHEAQGFVGKNAATDEDWYGAVAQALAASIGLLLFVGTFLLARRLSGALESPLAPLSLILTAASLLAWTAAVRLRLRDRRADSLAAFVLVFFAVACSFPGHRLIDWLVWLAAFAAFGLMPTRRSLPAVGSQEPDELLLQQLNRSRSTNGCEAIHGTIIAEFAPDERTMIQHVAFCPPFERLPSVEAEVTDGPACEVKIAQVLHQGARLEARLSRASTAPQRVTIEFAATDRPSLAD